MFDILSFDFLGRLDFTTVQILLAGISVICAFLVLFWPWLFQDNLEQRMREIENERERLRKKERARLAEGTANIRLSNEARPFFQAIAEKFRLLKRADDPITALPLRQAGYRGRAPVITYLASQLLVPPLVFPVVLFYLNIVLVDRLPLWTLILIAVVLAYFSMRLPDLYLRNKIIKRREEIEKSWPDMLDLLLLSVEAGMSIEMAFRKVADEIGVQSSEIAEELTLTLAELSFLQDRRQAYDNFAARTNSESVRSVITALLQAERYGTSLGTSLRALAQEFRDMRIARAEKKAAALPPRLTVPMILFFLPVLFAIIMTPAILQVLDAF